MYPGETATGANDSNKSLERLPGPRWGRHGQSPNLWSEHLQTNKTLDKCDKRIIKSHVQDTEQSIQGLNR